jgi:hypothetical protein
MVTTTAAVTSTMQIVKYHVEYNTTTDQTHLKQTTIVVGGTKRPKRHNSQRDSDQNCARTEEVLAITVRREFLFWRKVGRDSTENKAILEQTLSFSTLRCNQNCAFSGIAPTLTSPLSLNFAQN